MIGPLIFRLPDEDKRSFRLLERTKKKIINCKAAINFNIYIYNLYIYIHMNTIIIFVDRHIDREVYKKICYNKFY